MRRVATDAVVLLTFDAAVHNTFWLITDYLPEIADLPSNAPPSPEELAAEIDGVIEVLPVPRQCADAVLPAYWARPERYLEGGVHRYSSSLASLPEPVRERGIARLRADLADGRWHERHADLVAEHEVDWGFRLVVGRR